MVAASLPSRGNGTRHMLVELTDMFRPSGSYASQLCRLPRDPRFPHVRPIISQHEVHEVVGSREVAGSALQL